MPEIERYELASGPAYRFELDRREFFRVVGGGIVLLVTLEDAGAQESGGGRRRGGRFEAAPKAIGAWLHIGEDGRITVYSGKAEVGQNVRTSVTLAAAEELGVRPEAVRTVLGDTALTPFDAGTFGSRSTPVMFPQIRRAAAALREVLIGLAAERWKCDRGDVQVTDGKLRNRSGAELSFAELTRGRKILETISDATPLKPASEWTVAGRPLTKVNGRDFVTGRHRFASDVIRPGMLHGKVVRPAAFGATAASADIAAAGRIPGATVVQDRGFIAAAAADEDTLRRAAEAVRVEWSTEPQPSSRELYDYLRRNASPARGGTERGSIEDALKAADVKLESTYTVAYIAHTPLEPRAAVAEWEGGKLTVWTGTQRPFGVRGELAQAFGIAESDVHVIVPDTGSGYGGKHTGECAIEAARLARAAGKPVKLVWTREEEFTWAYARPAGVIDVRSGARRDGTLTAWEFHNYNSGGSAIQTLYDTPNQRIQFHASKSPLRQGSYRGLAATANHFARESHMDEMAHALRLDPLEFRLKNLKDPRLRAVLEAAAEKFGWARSRQRAGIAGGFEKGSYVACCAQVSVSGSRVTIERVVTAYECGAIVNPDQLRNQVEGAVIMGIGGALFEAMEFENGRVSNPRLSQYRVPRFRDVPALETILLDRKDLKSEGAGETPIVGIAPAVANAIFSATGVRLRSMPLAPKGLPAQSSRA